MCPHKDIRWDYKTIQTLDLLPSNSSMFCLCLCSSFPQHTHIHTPDAQMFSYTCWHLSHRRPARREATHTLQRGKATGEGGEEEMEKQRQSLGERKKKRKEWETDQDRGAAEKRAYEQNKREGKKRAWGPRTEPLQTVLMYVSWVSYTCPFNPSISGALAPSVLSGSSFISPSQGLISPCCTSYIFRVHTKLDFGALERENVLCVEKYGYYVSMIHKTHRKRLFFSEVSISGV